MEYCVFEYMYRDAANWKTVDKLVLQGPVQQSHVEAIFLALDSGLYFVAEQVGVPPLQRQHVELHGAGSSEGLDHAFHELIAIRPAKGAELDAPIAAADLAELASRFRATNGRWTCTLSPYGTW